MGVIVSKFGGSSIADANMFRRVRDIIESCPRRRYIVLSAPGKRFAKDLKITDLLNRSHHLFTSGLDGSVPLKAVKARFAAIIRDLNIDVSPEEFVASLEEDVRLTADHAASRGEYLCAKLFSLYADIPFYDAAHLIHFDENGRLLREKTTRSIQEMAKRLPRAVIPGFYGSLPDGSVKTFTRGGSDISGALIAAALNAELYENWTDVDGLMSADPACVRKAVHHPAVSYRQMRMLSHAGAKVLHPYCVEPVCEAGIPTVLKNTFAPENPGTYISDSFRKTVPCVCMTEKQTAVRLRDLDRQTRELLEALNIALFTSEDGSQTAVTSADYSAGIPVSKITLFGISESLHREACVIADPIAKQSTDSGLILLIRPESALLTLTKLHNLLFMPEDSRIP
ncbi:MAG: hypothetical protein II333_11100 [Clostridia bacterium]|nr:hypothetical protein [Clostridia bacterium]